MFWFKIISASLRPPTSGGPLPLVPRAANHFELKNIMSSKFLLNI